METQGQTFPEAGEGASINAASSVGAIASALRFGVRLKLQSRR